jgi:hypothetical protein
LIKLDNYAFKDTSARRVYDNFKNYDNAARIELMKSFENEDYDYTTMNAISRNYKNFVYYTNKLFYFLSLVDKNHSLNDDAEVQYQILSNYRASKSSYDKVKVLLIR